MKIKIERYFPYVIASSGAILALVLPKPCTVSLRDVYPSSIALLSIISAFSGTMLALLSAVKRDVLYDKLGKENYSIFVGYLRASIVFPLVGALFSTFAIFSTRNSMLDLFIHALYVLWVFIVLLSAGVFYRAIIIIIEILHPKSGI